MFKIFQRTKVEDTRRPHQFIQKRYSSFNTETATNVPFIDLDELSESERPVYESWWKDLDPFNLQKINNQTIFKFLNGCTLDHAKLAKILVLFEPAQDGLTRYQFFAMLRLIAHAQNGRKISRALVYLGAPIPHFHTNPIDALIYNDTRKSWYDYTVVEEKQSYSHSRSRSAGTASELLESNPYNYQPQEELHSSRSSLSLNTGQTLLLTQKFVYESPSIRHKNINNPFHHQIDPFDDENSSDDIDSPIYQINQKPNSHRIPAPPVPSQLTKPAFPKYTRNF